MPTTTTTTTSGRGNVKELLGTLFIAIVAIGVVYFRQTDGKTAAKAPWGDIPEGAPGDDFFGFWQGYLNQAAVGPLGDLWNFSLTKDVPGATVPTWYGENNYGGYLTRGGVQWYWVQFDQNMTDSNITYCGELRGFVDQLDPVRIRVAFPQLRRNATYIEWYLDHHFYNLTARLIWNLVDNGRKMHITFTMPADNVIHADLYMWRVPAIVPPAPTPEPCNMSFMDTKGDPAAPSYQDPVPIPHIDSVRNERYTKRDKDGKIYKARLGQGCPLGFDKNKKEKIAKAKALAPRGSYMGYEHCYLINPTMNFTMRFNMSYKENLTHVLFSASVPAGKDINTHWLALGITPLWPLMKGMDVVMGYFGQRKQEACVRSMYAEMDVGAPIPNEVHHVVLNRKVWTESNTMYVSFSRPFKTGYNDIVNPPNLHILPSISFAMGPAPGDCLDAPEYHGTTRGTYGWNWTHIGETLPPHMMCQSA